MINYRPDSGPFTHNDRSSTHLMYQVILALLPATIFGIYLFGMQAAMTLIACGLACIATEALCLFIMRKRVVACLDGSALLTGWLLAMSLPPHFPPILCAVGGAFAIVIGKQCYGGLGQNLFNPAMLGRVMLLICFPLEMTDWSVPFSQADVVVNENMIQTWLHFDGMTSATILGEFASHHGSGLIPSPAMALGHHAGSFGETSSVLLLLGGVFLIYRRIIHWAIPVSFLSTLLLISCVTYYLLPLMFGGAGLHFAPPSIHIFSGATLLAAFFIITDLVTSPTTQKGQLVYGGLTALLVWAIRSFGSYPEGVAFAVLLMNCMSPIIEQLCQPKPFGSQEAV